MAELSWFFFQAGLLTGAAVALAALVAWNPSTMGKYAFIPAGCWALAVITGVLPA